MKLEKFIQENREAFDTREPSGRVWQEIEAALPPPQKAKFTVRKRLQMAASVILLVGIGYLIGQYWHPVQQNPEIAKLSPRYAKQVANYTDFIQAKRAELHTLTAANPQLLQQFDDEFAALEADYKRLKEELPTNPNQEELLQAMMSNLEWQINILNQQLLIIQQVKAASNEETTAIL